MQAFFGGGGDLIWLQSERNSTGVKDFDALAEQIEELPTLYSIDLVNMDTCKNQLLLEDIRQYGRKI